MIKKAELKVCDHCGKKTQWIRKAKTPKGEAWFCHGSPNSCFVKFSQWKWKRRAEAGVDKRDLRVLGPKQEVLVQGKDVPFGWQENPEVVAEKLKWAEKRKEERLQKYMKRRAEILYKAGFRRVGEPIRI